MLNRINTTFGDILACTSVIYNSKSSWRAVVMASDIVYAALCHTMDVCRQITYPAHVRSDGGQLGK
jgi:hypothetical protein